MSRNTYDNFAGCCEFKRIDDEVIYQSDDYYICKRDGEIFYFHTWIANDGEDSEECIIRLNHMIVPTGILNIIDELLEYKYMYDELLD